MGMDNDESDLWIPGKNKELQGGDTQPKITVLIGSPSRKYSENYSDYWTLGH